MDEKRCSTCRVVQPYAQFSISSSARDGLQSRCRTCWREWYAANRDRHLEAVRLRRAQVRAEHQERVVLHLLEHPCVDCGEQDLRVLEFDHEDPTSKTRDVARLASMNIAWERVAAEIAKCSVRCASCHRRRTAEQLGYWRASAEAERRVRVQAQAEERLRAVLSP